MKEFPQPEPEKEEEGSFASDFRKATEEVNKENKDLLDALVKNGSLSEKDAIQFMKDEGIIERSPEEQRALLEQLKEEQSRLPQYNVVKKEKYDQRVRNLETTREKIRQLREYNEANPTDDPVERAKRAEAFKMPRVHQEVGLGSIARMEEDRHLEAQDLNRQHEALKQAIKNGSMTEEELKQWEKENLGMHKE
jgi:polyhydroxyalkanoate synthesis regulator phasin